ncbi:hypothetical protein [Citrobacter amalonaticus]
MTQRINEVMDFAMNAGLIVVNPVAVLVGLSIGCH